MRPPRSEAEEAALDDALLYASRATRAMLDLGPGRLARLLRRRIGMSQAEAARRVGRRQAWLSRFETGRADVKLGQFVRLLSVLYCRPLILARSTVYFDSACASKAGRKGGEPDP